MTPPLVSVVIPTRNGLDVLPAVLDAVAAQVCDFAFEIVAIDTASTDGTVDLLRSQGVRLLAVSAAEFDHGLTRNLAIEACRGAFTVLLSQDAEPANSRWLSTLVEPLRRDPAVAGSFARQLVRPDAGVIVRHYHALWAGSSPLPAIARIDDVQRFGSLSPLEQMRQCTFDNVCSCIRRSVWAEHPFVGTPIAEDLAWARAVLLAGHALAYVPEAIVRHSHSRPAWYEFERTSLLHYQLHHLFGLRTIPTALALLRALASTVALHTALRRTAAANIPREPLSRALALALAWPIGQFVGGRRAATGYPPSRSRSV